MKNKQLLDPGEILSLAYELSETVDEDVDLSPLFMVKAVIVQDILRIMDESGLSEKDKFVYRSYYGIYKPDNEEQARSAPKSPKELAAIFGETRQAIEKRIRKINERLGPQLEDLKRQYE